MDANQLIKALGDTAAAAKPPQEYCLLWIDTWATCMTKAEWSGWMQAIGAVMALVIAVALPYWQVRRARVANFALAQSCVANLLAVLYGVRTIGLQGDFPAAFRAAKQSVEALQLNYQEVRASEMPRDALPTWHGARTQSLQIDSLVANIDASAAAGWTYHKWLQQVETNIEAALGYLESLRAHDPRCWRRFKQRVL